MMVFCAHAVKYIWVRENIVFFAWFPVSMVTNKMATIYRSSNTPELKMVLWSGFDCCDLMNRLTIHIKYFKCFANLYFILNVSNYVIEQRNCLILLNFNWTATKRECVGLLPMLLLQNKTWHVYDFQTVGAGWPAPDSAWPQLGVDLLAPWPAPRRRHVPPTRGSALLSHGGQGQLHRLPHRLRRHVCVVPCAAGE